MNINSRFTEHGLTGAFLLLTQLPVLFFISAESEISYFQKAVSLLKTISDLFPTTFQPALAAVALVSIFFLGLCLELLSSYSSIWEIKLFQEQIIKNEGWLKPLVESNKSFVLEDYHKIRSSQLFHSISIDETKKGLNKYRLQKPNDSKKLGNPHKRFHSFLLSYIFVNSGSAKLELFINQVHLWKTSKAISTALLLVAIEILVLGSNLQNTLDVVILFALNLFLMILSAFLSLRSFESMSSTLFSILYIIANKQDSD